MTGQQRFQYDVCVIKNIHEKYNIEKQQQELYKASLAGDRKS